MNESYGYYMKKTKKSLVILLLVFSLLPLRVFAHDRTPYNWFVQNNDNHTPPVLHTNFAFAEKYNFYYLDKKAESDDKVIYLTFDAGYENGNVEKILNVLKEENVPGAFFILGNLIDRNPDLVKRMSEEGHLVCNHTNKHKNITKLDQTGIKQEIQTLEQAYTELTGKQMAKYFRPPEGTFDKDSLAVVQDCGYKTVFWSFAYADWDNQKQMNPQDAKRKIMDNLHNGEIMLLHPTSATNAAVLQEVIQEIKSMGYRIGSLDEISLNES